MIHPINTQEQVSVQSVGGKGFSLVRAAQSRMRVPEGFILSTEFFRPWMEELRSAGEWKGLSASDGDEVKSSCRALKEKARGLELDPGRARLLKQTCVRTFNGKSPGMAVRSSSPEEDASGSSFAGAYESILGVTEAALEKSIRDVFASCLDERIVAYKRERGYDPADVKIAVIVQRLVDAERSGVAFSANPLNNDLDEVLINASFGLGESIVSGAVTPDTYIFDRIRNRVVGKTIGTKETAVFAGAEGGTEQRPVKDPAAETLSDGEAAEIAEMCAQAEEMLGRAADVEWAYEGGVLYLLQARPITTLFDLPPALETPRGSPRRLYVDFTLVGQGMPEPMSVLGCEFFDMVQKGFMTSIIGLDIQDINEGFFGSAEGRSIMNVTNMLKTPGGRGYAKKLSRDDPIVRSTLDGLPAGAYLTPGKPRRLRFFLFKVLRNALGYVRLARKAYDDPLAYKAFFQEECRRRLIELDSIGRETGRLSELARRYREWFSSFVSTVSMAMTTAAQTFALQPMQKELGNRGEAYREAVLKLERGLPDNITVEMGLDLEELASFSSFRKYESYAEWLAARSRGEVPEECGKAFDAYLERYGFRSPAEMDIRSSRPLDDPASFYRSVRERAVHGAAGQSGRALFEKTRREREEAYAFLKNSMPEGKKGRRFEKQYAAWTALGGYREIHKYYIVLVIHRLRKKAMEIGSRFASEGRLRRPEDIFDLTFDQIEKGLGDPNVPLEEIAAANTAWRRTHWAPHREFPAVFDSRGRILRPPARKAADGEYQGQGISAGTVEGRIKVLHSPEEKPLLPGEILVARATDPGWTPLFVPAAAVILEIGGPAQHGAVVAREYGKPCIAGIEGATELFGDGDLVRVDGAAGIVRIVHKAAISRR